MPGRRASSSQSWNEADTKLLQILVDAENNTVPSECVMDWEQHEINEQMQDQPRKEALKIAIAEKISTEGSSYNKKRIFSVENYAHLSEK